MSALGTDLKVALRTLRLTPTTSLLAVLVLGLGIGANSAMFSLINTLVLRPLPVHEPERLVNVLAHNVEERDYRSVSYPNFADLREGVRAFESLTAHTMALVGIGEAGETRRSFVDVVASNYFETFGVAPILGRPFLAEEERPGAGIPVAILGYRAWRRMGGREDILGDEVILNGRPFTIVGVAPKGFAGTSVLLAPELFAPLGVQQQLVNDFMESAGRPLVERDSRLLLLVGRLASGTGRSRADDDLARLSAALEESHPEINRSEVYEAHPFSRVSLSTSPSTDDGVSALSTLLLAMALAVLIVAGLNLAALQGARNLARRREIAVRLALGCGRLRVVRQLVTESLLLALGGGALGLAIAAAVPNLLAASMARLAPFELLISGELDWRIIGATLAFSLLAALVVGLFPALRSSRPSLTEDLRDLGDSAGRRRFRIFARGDLPVVFELALSMVLLVSAGLFVKAALRGADVDAGFALDSGVLVEIDPSLIGYDEARGRQAVERLRERLGRLPGVEVVASAATVPFGMVGFGERVIDTEAPPPSGEELPGVGATFNIVSDGYFSSLGIPLLQGREFQRDEAAPAVIVDRLLAERLWEGESPIGRRVRFADTDRLASDAQVIGVVGTVRDSLFDRTDHAHVYLPASQGYLSNQHLHLRVSGDPGAGELLQGVRNALREVDARLPVLTLRSLRDHLDGGFEIWTLRAAGRLFGTFAGFALVLAVAGVYGVRAYSVARRTREIGLRMALGATRPATVGLILRDGLRVSLLGATLGLVAAAGTARLLQSFLFGVDAGDPVVFLASFGLLAGVAVLACLGPAGRASRLDPWVALRVE